MHLYLDTSHFLAIGLLDNELNWQHFEKREQLQHAGDIHARIHQILDKHGIEALDLSGVIICNGPGSYTGIRLGEGIGQLFELTSIPVYSFHQYEVPKILGVKKGQWVCHAFKREVFQYIWDGEQASSSLIAASDWQKGEHELYGHQPSGPWQEETLTFTTDLIEQNPKPIFEFVISNNIRREAYYFRPLDKEFKRSVV